VNDEPDHLVSGEFPRIIRRQPDDPQTSHIRRPPTGPNPTAGDDTPEGSAPRTGIIRRAPTGPVPTTADDSRTGYIEAATGLIQQPPAPAVRPAPARPWTSIAAAAVSIVSGWATSVIATSLIAGWWDTDRLFCVAVGFLAGVFAVATVAGLILLLLRESIGRWLIIAGAVVALLTFAGVFVAGGRIPWAIYAVPILPVASVVLSLLPATRWWGSDRP
jgi:hypothetical protein